MVSKLNPPERIIKNLRGSFKRMGKVDKLLGNKPDFFAVGVSRILAHAEPLSSSINGFLKDQDLATEIALFLISSATELETSWNLLRLANIPAVSRQNRVAFEFVALTVLSVLPTATLLQELPNRLNLVKCLQENQGRNVIDIYKPTCKQQGRQLQKKSPPLKETFDAFFRALELIIRIPIQKVQEIQTYVEQKLHPSAHSSVEVWLEHFAGFTGDAAGAVFMPERAEMYKATAGELGNLSNLLADILDKTRDYLASISSQS